MKRRSRKYSITTEEDPLGSLAINQSWSCDTNFLQLTETGKLRVHRAVL